AGSAAGVAASFGASASVAFVTPALKRGLKPAGLLEAAAAGAAAGVSEVGGAGSAAGVAASFGASVSVAFVTPAVKLGLNPAGLLDAAAAGAAAGVSEVAGAGAGALGVSTASFAASVAGVLVAPALKRGLKPAGLLEAAAVASAGAGL